MKLNASKREILGKRARSLLREGKVPAVVYGHHAKSVAVTIDGREFEHVFKRAGHTQLVDLTVDGGRAHKVLIKEIQIHPRRHGAAHIDLLQVSMREKLHAQVPVALSGEAPAVLRGEADVLQVLHQVRVECLPNDIPEAFTVDVSGLESVGDGIRVADLAAVDGVTILDDPEEVIVKAQPRRELAEEEPEAAEAEAAGEGQEGAKEGAEGAAPAAEQDGEGGGSRAGDEDRKEG